ncbi:MAG: tetratricopeptide repeat protein [candidate division Zixibacteria bacterium]|nr:tetratricopeptide repeat protein [candidate division Zixibacteria bacterium]
MDKKTLKQNILALSFAVIMITVVGTVSVSAETLNEVVENALATGDTTQAIVRLEKEIEIDPTYHYNYYVLGRIYFNQGKWGPARDQFRLALDKKGKHYESMHYLGLCQLELGELEAAEKTFSKGLKKARDMKDTFEYCMGLTYMAQEKYSDADRSIRRALAIDSTVADYHIALGNANFYQGVPALAVASYEKALAVDTASTEVYFRWAEACLEMKDYNCAIEKLRVVLTKDSTFAQAWNRAAGIYFKAARSIRNRQERTERFMDVIGSYEKYIELTGVEPDSSSVRVFFETAMSYQNIRRYEDAVTYFEKVLAIPYEPRDIYFYYGKSLWGARDYAGAAEAMHNHEKWVDRQDENYESRINKAEFNKILGDAYFYQKPKDYYNASKYYKRSLDERPGQDRLLQNIAVSYHNMKRYREALEYYDLRIEEGIDSIFSSIYKNAALCALHLANPDEDEEEMEDEMEDEEDATSSVDPNVDYNEVAIGYMSNYLELKPYDTSIVERIANTYLYQMSDCANGVDAFERLLALDPNNCQAKKSLGFAYFGGDICTKNLDKTIRYLSAAYECLNVAEGPCADPALVKWIAQAYHLRAVDGSGDSNSDYKNAFEWYGKVLKCTPADSEAKKGLEDTRFEFN